jgi:hypothetical protein
MRLVIALLFLIFQAAGQSVTAEPAKTVQVHSYVRKDGTVVRAYTRAASGTGTAPRSTAARRAFQAQQPCPLTQGHVFFRNQLDRYFFLSSRSLRAERQITGSREADHEESVTVACDPCTLWRTLVLPNLRFERHGRR